jgi:hypothetical protein
VLALIFAGMLLTKPVPEAGDKDMTGGILACVWPL